MVHLNSKAVNIEKGEYNIQWQFILTIFFITLKAVLCRSMLVTGKKKLSYSWNILLINNLHVINYYYDYVNGNLLQDNVHAHEFVILYYFAPTLRVKTMEEIMHYQSNILMVYDTWLFVVFFCIM